MLLELLSNLPKGYSINFSHNELGDMRIRISIETYKTTLFVSNTVLNDSAKDGFEHYLCDRIQNIIRTIEEMR